ncbi:MAG TPA: hypothetical protein DCP32_02835, partial [Anaerolineaceae bacterium]|nr:hypothetical protein [Anaerolineaceae bacterium]
MFPTTDPSQTPSIESSLLAGLTDAEAARVRSAARSVHKQSGGVFFMQGDSAEAVYQIENGRVRLSQ